MKDHLLAIFGLPGGWEWILILLVALLLFGGRLPEVARSIGRSIVEFKKGMRDVKDDLEKTSRLDQDSPARRLEQKDESPPSASRNSTADSSAKSP